MNSTGVMFLDETQSTGVIFVFYLSANPKVLHKFTREKSVKCIFSIQMLELRRSDLVVHLVAVFRVHKCSCMHLCHCTHARHHAGIFARSHSAYICIYIKSMVEN